MNVTVDRINLADSLAVKPDLSLEHLLAHLAHLDILIQRQVRRWQAAGQNPADGFRGLYITAHDASALAARPLGADWGWTTPLAAEEENNWATAAAQALAQVSELNATADAAGEELRLNALARFYGLDEFAIGVLLLALAPELDLRYEKLYAYLQDDVAKKRPTVSLALDLLCSTVDEKIERRIYFAADGPLFRHNVLELIADPTHIQPPLLAHYLKLDDQILRFLLGQGGLDRRLAPFCQLLSPASGMEAVLLPDTLKVPLLATVNTAWQEQRSLILSFHGPSPAAHQATAAALAGAVAANLLVVDLTKVLDAPMSFDQTINLVLREAWLQDALLYLDSLDALRSDERSLPFSQLVDALARATGVTILAGSLPWQPTNRQALGVIDIPFALPDFALRQVLWRAQLAVAGVTLDNDAIDALAGRFRLSAVQIADAVTTAYHRAALGGGAVPTLDDLLAGARAQAGHDLARLAHKIEPVYTWADLVLPADTLTQLHEICQRVAHRHQVLDAWGFGGKLSLGKGVTVLFAGPSGTGKTMAAEVLANDLGMDLYKIDLSGVVSKYIGETEKNLERIFTAATNANAFLFFDEADALFGKRSEVRDAHDRYANIEISYLLQKMEEYDGVAILATNLRQNLDEAFVRRLAYTVHFPFPDETSRRRIWQGIWPAALPLGADVDLDFLACHFKLSGGNIRNIALAGAFLAAADGQVVTMDHLRQATRREYQKLGKTLTEDELVGEKVIS